MGCAFMNLMTNDRYEKYEVATKMKHNYLWNFCPKKFKNVKKDFVKKNFFKKKFVQKNFVEKILAKKI